MSKKRIPFDITKMNKDFSNVVYRDGTRPQFVCEAKNSTWAYCSIYQDGMPKTHKLNGLNYDLTGRRRDKDLLLEVDQPYPTLEELSEDVKVMMPKFVLWLDEQPTSLTVQFSDGHFDTVYTKFLNSQEK